MAGMEKVRMFDGSSRTEWVVRVIVVNRASHPRLLLLTLSLPHIQSDTKTFRNLSPESPKSISFHPTPLCLDYCNNLLAIILHSIHPHPAARSF